MLIFLALSFFIGFLISFIFSQLLPISSQLHNQCLLAAPSSHWQEYYQAIVCGSNLAPTAQYQLLQELGLLHIIVVSGSHLLFFSNALSFLPKKLHIVKYLGLFLFVMLSRMDPPVLRAFLFLLIIGFVHKYKLFYSNYQSLLASIFFCIGLQTHWICSRSLLLSWAASLGIIYGKNVFTQAIFCYILILPLIADFATHSPLSIIINSTLTPVISLFLFPLSFISFLLPISSSVDKLWDLLFLICKNINLNINLSSMDKLSTLELQLQWFYLLSLNLFAIESRKRQWI